MAADITGIAASSVRLLNSFQSLIVIVFCFFYLFWLSPAVGGSALLMIFAGVFACMALDRGGRKRIAQAHRQMSTFFNRVEDTLHGFKEIRLNERRRRDLEGHVVQLLGAIKKLSVAADRRLSLSQTTAQTGMFLQLGVIVFLLPMFGLIDSATSFQVLTVILFISGPVDNLLGGYPALVRARVSLERLQALERDLERTPVASVSGPVAETAPPFNSITLEGVRVSLAEAAKTASGEETQFVVGPIDLTIRRGEIVFIHGGNGSGKTTLLSALCGLRQIESGRILLDGVPVDAESAAYHAMFSGVFADFHLFRRLYGIAPEAVGRLTETMRELNLPKRVAVEEGEFVSLSLSAGQRRRLALSVALAEDRPVLLCDEFAADQDPAHRRFFYEDLLPELRAQGRTIIAITHDENRFHLCDQLIKMDQGRVVAVQRGRFASPSWIGPLRHEPAAE
jgi:putative ATP-binding cassette transporter